MAIRAADDALRDFTLDRLPGRAAVDESGDVGLLVAKVIELERNDIGHSAVHAGVRSQVLNGLPPVLGAPRPGIPEESPFLRLVVFPVVLLSVLCEARPAPGLELRLAAPDRRKGITRLHHSALRARSHEGDRSVDSTS